MQDKPQPISSKFPAGTIPNQTGDEQAAEKLKTLSF